MSGVTLENLLSNQTLLAEQVLHLNRLQSEASDEIDVGWTVDMAMHAFYMQAGFTMLEAGCVRAKNTRNIILKNVFDTCVSTIVFFMFGFGFGFGCECSTPGDCSDNPVIGLRHFFLMNFKDYGLWFFQSVFLATAATIPSGAMAERTQVKAYLLHSIITALIIYPIPAYWIWTDCGWLRNIGQNGALDFAGSGVVHVTGGLMGLIGAYYLGPRNGRFDAEGNVNDLQGHSAPLTALGCFILWFGWYGFNSGSSLGLSDGRLPLVQSVFITSTLAAAVAASVVLTYTQYVEKKWDLTEALNGILAGLVSVTASCAFISPWASFPIGVIGAIVYVKSRDLLLKLQIDDTINAVPVHFGCGAWGLIASGLFVKQDLVAIYRGASTTHSYGLFEGGGAEQLGVQLLALVSIMIIVAVPTVAFFKVLLHHRALRVDRDMELAGIDNTMHGGPAYGDFLHQ